MMVQRVKGSKRAWLIGLMIIILSLQSLVLLSSAFAEGDYIIHKVQYGEYLSTIAKKYNVTKEAIVAANNLSNANVIIAGQELKIPTNGEVYALDATDDDDWGKGGKPVNPCPSGLATGNISIDVVNADIRDVLTAISMKLCVQILYIDEPIRVTFKIENVSPIRALELFVQTYSLSYIKDGNLIIVGKLERLQTDFYKQMVITRFNLQYISADTLKGIISSLGIPLQQISMTANPQILWIQGTPQAVYKVAMLVDEVDIPGQQATLVSHTLQNVSAQYASDRLVQFGFQGIQIITLNYPEFSKNLVIVVPAHLAAPVKTALESIDSSATLATVIRMPLAQGEDADLSILMNRLNYAFANKFSAKMVIIDGYLWVEETPDNIKVISDMLELIQSVGGA